MNGPRLDPWRIPGCCRKGGQTDDHYGHYIVVLGGIRKIQIG